MGQSLSAVYLHLIFSTKNREPWLIDPAFREQVLSFIGGISPEAGCPPIIVGGVADHVHLLARFGRDICQADWVKETKRVSSLWIKDQRNSMAGFSWQAGYGIFSVSASSV
ncbi:MAG: transposase [Verrucomicrobiales bacterium]